MSSLAAAEDDETGWQSDEEGDTHKENPTPPLFSPFLTLPSVVSAYEHDMATYGFDLKTTAAALELDEYGVAKVVNFIRNEIGSPIEAVPEIAREIQGKIVSGASFFEGDTYLKPAFENDPFLQSLGLFTVDDWSDEEEGVEDETVLQRQLDVALAKLELAKRVGGCVDGSASTAEANGSTANNGGGSGQLRLKLAEAEAELEEVVAAAAVSLENR